jgi:hypothetical protein
MGKAAVVEFEGTRYTLSLISWGILRRTMQGAAAKAMMGVPFVPGYGLAVWQGAASTQILDLLCYFQGSGANSGSGACSRQISPAMELTQHVEH